MNTLVIAEIGINHNGNIEITKKMIDIAAVAGVQIVKFQKRTPELCVPKDQWEKMRDTPWGYISYIEYRRKMEFGRTEYDIIDKHCKDRNIEWTASAWDLESQEFLRKYDLQYNKVASAMLTNKELLEMISEEGKHTFISTGMSTLQQIDAAVAIFDKAKCPYTIFHCTSTYPCEPEHLNLNMIKILKDRYKCRIGYSGHEVGINTSAVAVALGAEVVERHITLDRAMWGTDQSASLEPQGLMKLVKYIDTVEKAMGDGEKKVYKEEESIMKKLRNVDNTLEKK